ncbi:MAG: tRNA 2-thiouridine(34) synthase MnmA [Chloroflexota bacterium]
MSDNTSALPRVVVAMSGGVDSSVAAALLAQQGYPVVGVMLRLWNEPGSEEHNRCCTPDAMAQARRVAAILGIPFYAVDAQEIFRQQVVQALIDGYTQGATPNPCLVCNRRIRWGFLWQRAQALGGERLATGHYARLQSDGNGRMQLLKGCDEGKDQSYVLHMLNQEQLAHTLLPLGGYSKAQVREMARRFGLPVAERPDSQDLCFLGEGDYRSFLSRHAPQVEAPGTILTQSGESLGEHRGLAFYTIGQRKGLGLSAPQPLYVLAKDLQRNALIVGRLEELGGQELTAAEVNWIAGQAPKQPVRAQAKIRYKAQPEWAQVTPLEGQRAQVRFERRLRDITPGQAVVFYDGETCLGGGTIQ